MDTGLNLPFRVLNGATMEEIPRSAYLWDENAKYFICNLNNIVLSPIVEPWSRELDGLTLMLRSICRAQVGNSCHIVCGDACDIRAGSKCTLNVGYDNWVSLDSESLIYVKERTRVRAAYDTLIVAYNEELSPTPAIPKFSIYQTKGLKEDVFIPRIYGQWGIKGIMHKEIESQNYIFDCFSPKCSFPALTYHENIYFITESYKSAHRTLYKTEFFNPKQSGDVCYFELKEDILTKINYEEFSSGKIAIDLDY